MSTSSIVAVASGVLIFVGAAGASLAAKDGAGRSDASKFVTIGQCQVPEGRYLSARSRFRGALKGASYGDIFFAGGAGNRGNGSSKESGSNESRGNGGSSNSPGAVNGGGDNRGGGGGQDAGRSGAPAANAPGQGVPTTPVDAGPGGAASVPVTGPAPAGGAVGPLADVVPSPNPEPASLLLIGTGLTGLLFAARGRRRQKP